MNARIALLRGINVGGHNKVPMAELRQVCAELGWTSVSTYIQSGNVVFGAPDSAKRPELERALQIELQNRFQTDARVLVRTLAEWTGYGESNPFPEESAAEPNRVMLVLTTNPLAANSAALTNEHARNGERAVLVGDALWIHFAAGQAKSRITPAFLERACGSPATARNWRTVLKIREMADQLRLGNS